MSADSRSKAPSPRIRPGMGEKAHAKLAEELRMRDTEVGLRCAYCGGPAEGNYSIHRDGFGIGPDVPLCDKHGSKPTPTEEQIWRRIREGRFAQGERICIGCGAETAHTFGGLCIDCDVAEMRS